MTETFMSALASATAPVLACRHLHKSYNSGGKTVTVLRDVNLTITAGSSTAIVGASGSGKTTLLHLLGGLDSPSGGEIFAGGKNWAQLTDRETSHWRNQQLAFVFQFHLLLPEFTVIENAAMPLLLRRAARTEALATAADCLRAVNLSEHENKTPEKLSGGERQRVAVARALAGNPRCLLADEPTGNLDSDNVKQVFDLLLAACHQRQTALLLVSHDDHLTAQTDRRLTLADGTLTE